MMTIDISRFQRSLREVRRVSKRSEAEIVNKALKDVAFRSASFTPKSNAAKIRGELQQNKLAIRLAVATLKKRRGKFNSNDVKDMAARIVKARTSHVSALRAGWIPAIQKLGGNYRGAKLSQSGTAADGTASKATIWRLSGFIRNSIVTKNSKGRTSAGNITVLKQGLAKAIDFVTNDRETYAATKMRAALRRITS